jgi:hypothetical protein
MNTQNHQNPPDPKSADAKMKERMDESNERMAAIWAGSPRANARKIAELERHAQECFVLHAVVQMDPLTWSRFRQARAKERDAAVRERAVEIVAQKHEDERDKAKAVIASPELTPEEKEARVHEIFGI